jgi:hypothetical protein
MPDTAVSRKRQILGCRAYDRPLLRRAWGMIRNVRACVSATWEPAFRNDHAENPEIGS